MSKIKIYLAVFFLFIFSNLSIAQTLSWVKQIGDIQFEYVRASTVDQSGNLYITGFYNGTVDFDPGPGTYTLSSGISDMNAFVCKLDASGNFIWVRNTSGTGETLPQGIAIDNNGVYVTGNFNSTVNFNPLTSANSLTPVSQDIFVWKLDLNGNFGWVKSIGATNGTNTARSIALDQSGNIFTTGYFGIDTDFDPGAGTFTLFTVHGDGAYVSKLDPSGNFLWAKAMGSTYGDEGHSLTVDPTGNVLVTGRFNGLEDFNPTNGPINPNAVNLTSSGLSDMFVCKFSNSGNFIWGKKIGSNMDDSPFAIAADASGFIYLTGHCGDGTDFDPGPGTYTLTSGTGYTGFLCKLDAAGNFAWARNFGNNFFVYGKSMAISNSGNVHLAIAYHGTVALNATPNYTFSSVGGNLDILVATYDSSGGVLFASSFGGPNIDNVESLALDKTTNAIYLSGEFSGSVDFNPGVPNWTYTSQSQDDIFILKIDNSNITGINNYVKNSNWNVYPNPAHDKVYFQTEKNELNKNYFIIDNLGRCVKKGAIGENLSIIEVSDLRPGFYVIMQGNSSFKLLIE